MIVDYYLGIGADHMGRKLEEVLAREQNWFENTHDYIQWLFPLYVGSKFNPNAPVLTDEVRAIFLDSSHAHHATLQKNLGRAIDRMFLFYGFMEGMQLEPPEVREVTFRIIGQDDDLASYPLGCHLWLREGNHNQLRITRILHSMTLLGRQPLAAAFHAALLDTAQFNDILISPETLKFWDQAVREVPGAL